MPAIRGMLSADPGAMTAMPQGLRYNDDFYA